MCVEWIAGVECCNVRRMTSATTLSYYVFTKINGIVQDAQLFDL